MMSNEFNGVIYLFNEPQKWGKQITKLPKLDKSLNFIRFQFNFQRLFFYLW